MINISENAGKELESYFADKEKGTIRIYLSPGGWSGPRLALALDEPNDDDKTFTVNDFYFCINGELLEQVKSISIDLTYMGFTVEPEIPLRSSASASASACSGCSSAGNDGSCSTQ